MSERISIIMPAYNLEKYISDSIMSVQRQTYTDWQLLVIDDGSKDETPNIVQAIAVSDQRVQLLCQKNSGSAGARNAGLNAATGKYIAFLDGDDLWEPTFLAELLAAKQAAGTAMAYCGYLHLYDVGLKSKFSYPYVSGDILEAVIRGKTQVHIGCLLVDKSVIEQNNIRFTEGCLIGQDQEFIIKLVAVAEVQAVPRELMQYRIRAGSAINSQWNWQKHIHAILGLKRAAAAVLVQKAGVDSVSQLENIFQQRIAYKVFKFLWRMLKKGHQAEVRELMEADFGKDFAQLDVEQLKLVDRIKYRVVCSQNPLLWDLVAKLKVI
ncbi:glycosyltransferase family 2 protein [Sporomusa sphaeroides]|uniref:UDP-Glc:alpha-D-GlcNAc-diphosphoundecaprenol beta-1,3-glucosyltransferase WfgD n=1 Tax=Sporomusa sphaeroides DSM 2875 TaxID=1337886 RepID=A0ABM9W466_9FIRM|nr:glycosyltransferase family 2 protein [Sporomusa sphaeroides]OLS55517.1 UDP-Glc:alpha-D-GlcNAc-diphosphoundecaprenol beta-1,3-glucosyltransferase WfgD [Sporomusa sphaeroides DSM 2875]CVK19946.1 UDP-Glc:alpha-D-GlcNAc-diphosphoundecaprenol beta-1,3-glucosyltransferase WfgD [Sporomusa sphaeroides DSM 2875]